MTAIALNALNRAGSASPQEDGRLALARERLQKCRSKFAALPQGRRQAVLAYEGPEVSGNVKSKRRPKA